MRLLAINQFYAPDEAATSQLLTDLCEDLAALGHEVSVIASRGGYLGGPKLPEREILRGVRVIRPWATSFGKESIPKRLTDYGSFFATAVGRAITTTRPDVILALTTPPLIATGALAAAKLRGVPLVAWVQDIYPEIAVRLGVLKESHPAVPILDHAARLTYRSSRAVVALSEGMADRLASLGAPRDKVRVIPNWADGRALTPGTGSASRFREDHGLEGRFVAMYSGNLGAAHDVETMIDAARLLENRAPEVVFVIIGDGVRRKEAELRAKGLGNVRFLPYQPRESIGESLSSADLHLVTLREGFEGLLVPSKMYGALAVGRPLFFVGPPGCEVARAIRDEGLGVSVRPGEAEGLAREIQRAVEDREAHRRLSEHARAVFLERYDRSVAVARWSRLLLEASGGQ